MSWDCYEPHDAPDAHEDWTQVVHYPGIGLWSFAPVRGANVWRTEGVMFAGDRLLQHWVRVYPVSPTPNLATWAAWEGAP